MPPVGWADKTKRHEIEDEDLNVRDADELNFVGAGVTVTQAGNEIQVAIPGGGIPALHSVSHQNGGVDELTLTGLAGLLATQQTPVDHDHSGDVGDGNTFDADNLTSGTASNGHVLTANGAGATTWEAPPGTALGILFFYNTASADPGTYKQMLPDHSTGIEQVITAAGLVDNDVIEEFVTDVGSPNAEFLLSGIYAVHIHALKSAGTKALSIYAEIYRRTYPGGAETLLGTTHTSSNLTGAEAEEDLHAAIGETDVDATDRLVVKIRARVTGAGTAPTAALHVEGDTFAHFQAPILVSGNHNHNELYYTEAEVDGLIASVSTTGVGTFLLSGGHAVWETGLQFRISAAEYYINSVLYTSAEQTITLDVADVTNPRIDVIALDTSGTVQKITGTPAADPSRPDVDPSTQLQVTFVLVNAGATEPEEVTTLLLYAENAGTPTEWAATDSGATIDTNSTNNPRSGTKDIEATNAVNTNWFRLTAAAALDITSYAYLVLNIRSKATWASTKSLRLSFRNGAVVQSSYVSVDDGLYGFESATTGAYQQIAIPLTAFAIAPGTLVDNLNVEVRGGGAAIGFYVDDVSLQGGVVQDFVGITVEEADARYRRLVSDYTGIAIPIDGGGSEITTGDKIDFHVAFPCTLLGWTLLGKTAGAIKLDIWKCTYAQYDDSTHPVDGDSICNGHEPEIAATGVKAQDNDISDWSDVTLEVGDVLRVNVDSVTDMIRCSLNFTVLKR